MSSCPSAASLVPVQKHAVTTGGIFSRSDNVHDEAVRSLVHVFVTCCLDYGNSLYANSSVSTPQRLQQRVQNCSARLAVCIVKMCTMCRLHAAGLRIVSMGDVQGTEPFLSRAHSLPGVNRPIGPWPIRSLAKSLPGAFAPWPIRSLAISFPGPFTP